MLEQPSGTENPSAWLRYATTQLQTVEPGEQAAKQQQQAAVAVRQAIRLGATERGSDETLHQAVLGCLLSGLEGSGVELRAAGPKDAEASGVS